MLFQTCEEGYNGWELEWIMKVKGRVRVEWLSQRGSFLYEITSKFPLLGWLTCVNIGAKPKWKAWGKIVVGSGRKTKLKPCFVALRIGCLVSETS